MAPKKFTDTVEVTREDQEKINKFSRLNQRLTDVDAAVSSRQKIVKDITDASEIVEELQITDDEAPGSSAIIFSNYHNLKFLNYKLLDQFKFISKSEKLSFSAVVIILVISSVSFLRIFLNEK